MIAEFINVYDLNLKKVAVLQNAYEITETKELNAVYELTFKLPIDDDKNIYCKPYYYIRYGTDGELYRIISSKSTSDGTGSCDYTCEHVIAKLSDILLFGSYTYGGEGIYTEDSINFLLSKQEDWQLGICDFSHQFEYGWEQENLLNALYSIPKEFSKPFVWRFDTSSYPWILHLNEIDTKMNPQFYIRAEKNMLKMDSESSHVDIANRIYALGYGEGVNQLNIKGAMYEDGTICEEYYIENTDSIAEYGLHEKVLIDRSYENVDSLLAFAKKTLDEVSVPAYTRTFDIVDLYPMTHDEIDKAEPGYVVKMTVDDSTAYITKTTKRHDAVGDFKVELSTRTDSVVDSIAELADRVRIESTYSQGATQIYPLSKDANAAPGNGKGSVINLYFPSEMRQINKVLAKIRLKPFRYYAATTEGGQQTVSTESSGGSGGGYAVDIWGSTEGTRNLTPTLTANKVSSSISWKEPTDTTVTIDGVNSIQTGKGYMISGSQSFATSYTTHEHSIDPREHSHSGKVSFTEFGSSGTQHTTTFTTSSASLKVLAGGGSHTHLVYPTNVGACHRHYIPIANMKHTHDFAHDHGVTASGGSGAGGGGAYNHTHTINLSNHQHGINPGIFETGGANAFDIYVNGSLKQAIKESSWEGDISPWLIGESGTIPRDSWIELEIRPKALSYVVSSIFIQGFCQSRGGGNY